MTELIEFLRAQLDEDERVARAGDRACLGDGWPFWIDIDLDQDHAAADNYRQHFNPARVLAEVDAKRRILGVHADPHECPTWDLPLGETCTGYFGAEGCPTLRLLALPYADHPDYDESWRP